jgi:hypothetical protein
MQQRWGVIHLCSTCILTFEAMVVAYDRQESGPNLGFVTGNPSNSSWGMVRMINTFRLKEACVPSAATLTFVERTGSPNYPHIKQVASVKDHDFRSTLYKDSLHIAHSTARVDRAWVQGRDVFTGGYDMVSCLGKIVKSTSFHLTRSAQHHFLCYGES